MIGVLLVVGAVAGAGRFRHRWVEWRRPVRTVDPVGYFEAVASELRRGASLRWALSAPLPESRLARLAMTGQPLALVAAELDAEFDGVDDLFMPGVLLAGRTGAPAASLFGQLADRARITLQLRRLRRTLTAQARLSAAVVGLIPLGIGVLLTTFNSSGSLTAPGPARIAVLSGLALQCTGLVVIALLLRANR